MAAKDLPKADMFSIGLVSAGIKHWRETGKTKRQYMVEGNHGGTVIEVRLVRVGTVRPTDIKAADLPAFKAAVAKSMEDSDAK